MIDGGRAHLADVEQRTQRGTRGERRKRSAYQRSFYANPWAHSRRNLHPNVGERHAVSGVVGRAQNVRAIRGGGQHVGRHVHRIFRPLRIEDHAGGVPNRAGGAPSVRHGGIAAEKRAHAGDGNGQVLRARILRTRTRSGQGIGRPVIQVVDVQRIGVAGDACRDIFRGIVERRAVGDVQGLRIGSPGSRAAHAAKRGGDAAVDAVDIKDLAHLVVDEQRLVVRRDGQDHTGDGGVCLDESVG